MIRMQRFFCGAAIAAAASLAVAGCGEPAPTGAPTNGNAAVATTPPAATPTTPAGPAGAPGQPPKPPLGMEDTVVGKVIGLSCYKKNPGNVDATIACAKAAGPTNERLAVLGNDGTVYIGDTDPRTGNGQLQPFVGEEVTVSGQAGEDAPDLAWADVKVKKIKMKLVKRNGPPSADAERIKPTGTMSPGGKYTPTKP